MYATDIDDFETLEPMSFLPLVTDLNREFVARQFDDLGPEACMAEITELLVRENPEVLDMVRRCATDIGGGPEVMIGFGMFYQLLLSAAADAYGRQTLHTLPRVSASTRDALARDIDENGAEAFTTQAIAKLERTNPQLLQMAHGFASRAEDYLLVMLGFALLYNSLELQSATDRKYLH